ncbi:Uncharacterised protein [Mycobacterium tuberculosis]|uniref:Uncharacterized protein n=1 Tax=Mycobacterium tuberculosis TaxID=1773 RepID=A0A655JRY3_MYCTX|nr:Uncharacterised protein [Mycobacterium tuberculosis]CNM72679.1 Uncharacterised protein [Mycobacterium tuberculosis]COX52601.1 Uncharacterised protein [Mycobacterium tuberculosis]
MVQDTIAPSARSTTDSAVIRRKCSAPPNPSCTPPTATTGVPPASAAVRKPIARTIHSQRGTDGSAPRGMCAIRAAASTKAAIIPIVTHPG